MKKTVSAYLAASLTTLLWGVSYLWSDSLLDNGIPVEFFVPVRMLLAGILLCLINKISGQSMKIQRKKDILVFVLLSLCVPFIYFLAETYGLKYTESPTITSLIVASNPVFSMMTGMIIFKEKFGRLNILGVFITLAGLWLVTYTYSSTGPLFLLGLAIIFIHFLRRQIYLDKILSHIDNMYYHIFHNLTIDNYLYHKHIYHINCLRLVVFFL